MLVAQHTDTFEAAHEKTEKTGLRRFLNRCQQQAIQANQPKLASLTFAIAPLAPWLALETLVGCDASGRLRDRRHIYYDSPQQLSVVGVGVAVGFASAGPVRFAKAQDFINFWQQQFLYAQTIGGITGGITAAGKTDFAKTDFAKTDFLTQASKGRFLCSATFFEEVTPACFEPSYVFVPEVQVATSAEAAAVTFNCLMSATTDIDALVEQIYRQLYQLKNANENADQAVVLPGAQSVTKDVVDFEAAVTAALRQVKSGNLHKVVLADVMDVVVPQPVNVVRSLQTLRHNHPDCTVFSVGNGKGQCFIGASPERLLNITNAQLTTDALAGSASRSNTPGIDRQLAQSLMSSEKERYEHRVVVEFILQQLRSLGLTPHYAASPQILQLLHIQHLHTPISAKLHSQQGVQPLNILAKLHPTPAVAGVPRQAACEFIRQHETFERGLYTAPLGWVDTDGNSEFIVGIRSALIDGCKARLYAGAGIVAGSEPARELAEIKLKLQTLLNALV
jgi:menaquinone-specific isochorismate synthase